LYTSKADPMIASVISLCGKWSYIFRFEFEHLLSV
jgi:hypothetical protein